MAARSVPRGLGGHREWQAEAASLLPRSALRERALGRLAGALFVLGALATTPSLLLVESPPTPGSQAILAIALLTGIVCLRLPWERFEPRAFNVVCALATAEAAYAVSVFGQLSSVFYFLVAIFAAYSLASRLELGLQLVLITLASLAPVLYDPAPDDANLRFALHAAPVSMLGAVIVAYLREQLSRSERRAADLAEEAGRLAVRIRVTANRSSAPPPGADR